MVHIYSPGYMKGEKGFERSFHFCHFSASLCWDWFLQQIFFQMYIFLGTCRRISYLLIEILTIRNQLAVRASKKSIYRNTICRSWILSYRHSDFIILILKTFDFITLTNPTGAGYCTGQPAIGFLGLSVMTWSMIFVFMGGVEIGDVPVPLYWLPGA